MDELIKQLNDARENLRVTANIWVGTPMSSPAYDARTKEFKKAEETVSVLRYRVQLEVNGLIAQAAKLLAELDK